MGQRNVIFGVEIPNGYSIVISNTLFGIAIKFSKQDKDSIFSVERVIPFNEMKPNMEQQLYYKIKHYVHELKMCKADYWMSRMV